MKKDSLPSKAIELLNKATLLYKTDLLLYVTAWSSQQNASKLVNKLIKDGLVAYKKINNDYALYLTRVGKNNLENDIVYNKDFHTTSESILNQRLQENTIKVLFSICGIPCFDTEKASLKQIRESILGINNKLDKKEAEAILNNGVYYTKKEYIDFINSISPGKADTFASSRFKGVYISNYNIYFVYMPERKDNKILRIFYEKELNLKKSAEAFKNFTDVYRYVEELCTYKQSKNDSKKLIPASKVFNEPYCLVVSDGNAEVYSMATGNPSGLIKGVDFSKISSQKKRIADLKAEEKADEANRIQYGIARTIAKAKYSSMFLDAYNDVYKRLFVVSRNISGVRSLDYLCSNTLESWHKESVELFKTNPKYFIQNINPIYPYIELVGNNKMPSIYLPVYEAKILKEISELNFNPTIVTYEDMLDTIAHATRRINRYYDADFYINDKRMVASLFDEDSVLYYDYSGYTKGELIIRNYLKEHNLAPLDANIYLKLPSLFNMNKVDFYNSVAKEKISVREVVSSIDTATIEPEKRKYNIKKTITLHVSADFHKKVKRAAKYDNLTIQQSLMKLIYGPVCKKSDEYNIRLQKMKKEWAKEKLK